MFNYEVKGFSDFLMEQKLIGKLSRMRTKFVVNILEERIKELDKDHYELIKEYGEKQENGELAIQVDNETGHTTYKILDIESYNTEIDILMNEELIIVESEDRKDMLEVIRDVVLNCESAFSGVEAVQYNRWCEIAESM